MSSKYKYWMLLLTLLCVVSVIFSILRVVPCEIGNDTFLGTIVTLMSIVVTLVIGYQIFSVVEFRGELQRQKGENQKLSKDNACLQQIVGEQLQKINKQKSRIEEGLNMCFWILNYLSGQDIVTSYRAFIPMLNALFYSMDSEKDDFEDIFSSLRLFISNMQGLSFDIPGSVVIGEKTLVNANSGHPFNGRPVDEYLDYCLKPIREVDDKIRSHKRFKVMQFEYNTVMSMFYKKIEQVSKDPQNTQSVS